MDRNEAEKKLMDFCYLWERRVTMHRNGEYDMELVKEYIKEKNKILDEMTRYEMWLDR